MVQRLKSLLLEFNIHQKIKMIGFFIGNYFKFQLIEDIYLKLY